MRITGEKTMTMTTGDELALAESKSPGAILKLMRQQKGFSQEYVASRLHLRVRMIELLEEDDYARLPQAVFVKGYLRAYAKLLSIEFQPLLDSFNADYAVEAKLEKALWQIKPEPNKAEKALRWFTALFAIIVLVAVAFWWQQSRQLKDTAPAEPKEMSMSSAHTEVRLTDLSKMQSYFSTNTSADTSLSLKEKQDG